MKIFITLACFVLFISNLVLAQNDSTALSDAIQSYLSQYHPRVGIMAQFASEIKNSSATITSEFTIRNLRLILTGGSGEHFKYYFQGNLNGVFHLLDLKLSYQINDMFTIDAGRLKSPFGVDFLTNDAKLLWVNRSTVGKTIGPFRQYGLQLKTTLFEKRAVLITGAFNGDSTFDRREISLYIGKLHTIPIQKNELIPNLQFELGGSFAFTNDKNDLYSIPYVEKNIILYGFNTRLNYSDAWLESEYMCASTNNKKSREGFYVDVGYKILPEAEILSRFDWYSNYYWTIKTPLGVFRKYLVGGNYYPLKNTKLQLNYERDQTLKTNSIWLNFQYAVNFE